MNIITTKPIAIDSSVTKTCVNIVSCCGEHGVPDNPFVIRIKRAGTCNYLIEYDGVVDGDSVCFLWDKLLWDLPCGRYIGDIFESGNTCCEHIGRLQFQVGENCWKTAHIKDDEQDEDSPVCNPEPCDC